MRRFEHWELALRRLRARLAPVLYAGTAMCCPVCEGSYRTFRPAGGKPERRLNAVCPRCRSRERDRLAVLFLRRLTAVDRVLHVAPEACLKPCLRALARERYVTADLARQDVDERFDLLAIPHPDAAFGGAYCSHVLQDVRDDIAAMREIFRVLKSGGWAILNVPVTTARTVDHADAPGRRRAVGDPRPHEHLRTYGPDFAARMESVGFRVRSIGADELASADQQARFGIATAAAGVVHFGTKP